MLLHMLWKLWANVLLHYVLRLPLRLLVVVVPAGGRCRAQKRRTLLQRLLFPSRRRIFACLAAFLARIHPVSYGAPAARLLPLHSLFHEHHATEESGGVVAGSTFFFFTLANQVVIIIIATFFALFDFVVGCCSSQVIG